MEELFQGKTVERVETSPPSPYDGRPDPSRIVLHFTDGSAVEIVGGGDDFGASVEVKALSHGEQLERAHKACDYEREQEEAAIKRREWMALPCEQREAELARREQEGPVIRSIYLDVLTWQLEEGCSAWFPTPERTVRDRCPKCRERECPNAPERLIPAKPGIAGSAITSMGSALSPKIKARRS